MRFASYNVEWFDALFSDDGSLLEDGTWSSRYKITRADQVRALGRVFIELDANAVMIIEAPDTKKSRDTVRALENFAARFELRCRKAIKGFDNDTQQQIALLYDPDQMDVHHDPVASEAAPRFDGKFRIDLDIDARADVIGFSKPPLEVAVTTAKGAMRMIGVHVKSKAPHGARSPEEVMRLAIANRRKQLAQAIWLRARVDDHLAAGDPLIVMGDFNDRPGLDEYEKLFGRSSLEIVLGCDLPRAQQLFDPHAARALQSLTAATQTSARFYIPEEKRYLSALLDYIMVSPDLRAKRGQWRIWHPFEDAACYAGIDLRTALLVASDHFPVVVDLDL